MLHALARSSWGQETATLLLTYNALGKSIASCVAPVWITNASDSSFKKIQTAQNAALRMETGAHKMSSIDHLHQEFLTLKVKDHSDMLFAQYLVNYMEEDHVCHGLTTQEPRPRPMKESLHSRQHSTVLPRLGASRKESLQNLHTHAVESAIQLLDNNRVLKERPPPISDEEQRLNRRQRCTLSQLRSGHCYLLQDYKHNVFGEPNDICTDCGASPQDVRHLFVCNAHQTDFSSEDLWRIRWDQFVRLATSTTGILTDLTMDLFMANNNMSVWMSVCTDFGYQWLISNCFVFKGKCKKNNQYNTVCRLQFPCKPCFSLSCQ